MTITCRTDAASRVSEQEILDAIALNAPLIEAVQRGEEAYRPYLGWYEINGALIDRIEAEARRIQSLASVMIVIGIGGSNRATIGVYDALKAARPRATSLLFSGDSLSAQHLQEALKLIRSSDVAVTVIAKDFNTIEPGITFRLIRQELERKWGSSASERIVAIGSAGPGQLKELAHQQRWSFFAFDEDVGGRFSAFSAVALFPLAVGGIDVRAFVDGGRQTLGMLRSSKGSENPAVRYATFRFLARERGIAVEALTLFEPTLHAFGRWWVQLFAESEGKGEQILLPVIFDYSEDLHAVGQYVQEGPKMIMETFLDFGHEETGLVIEPSRIEDGFSYLDGTPFSLLNRTVYQAALEAHRAGGVECIELSVPRPIDESSLGSLFSFFLFSVYLSCRLLGVHPFTQPGVEQYKRSMYTALKKPGYGNEEESR